MKSGKKWTTDLALELESLFFKENVAEEHIEKLKIPSGVTIYSGNISLSEAKHAVKDRSLVIFASQDMQRNKSIYHELLKLCIEQEISTIVFSEKPDLFTQQIARQFYTLIGLLDGASKEYRFGSAENHFGVRFTLTQQAQLASCSNLLESELSELGNHQSTLMVANGTECIGNLSKEQIQETILGSSLI